MRPTMSFISGKQIVLGVSGSIAAYKIAELARNLTLDGALVNVIMTESARRFVGEATFQALTGRPVLTDMWALPEDGVVGHERHAPPVRETAGQDTDADGLSFCSLVTDRRLGQRRKLDALGCDRCVIAHRHFLLGQEWHGDDG